MNQINIKKWGIFICTPVFLIAILLLPQATATILYKRYMVSTVDGQDILCEPYIVQKNDFVTKILNVKGEILS